MVCFCQSLVYANVYIYIHIFPNIVYCVHIMFIVCMFSWITIWYWIVNGCALSWGWPPLPWGGPSLPTFRVTQLSVVLYIGLRLHVFFSMQFGWQARQCVFFYSFIFFFSNLYAWVEGVTVNRPLILWWKCLEDGEGSLVLWSGLCCDPVNLESKRRKCTLIFFSLETVWLNSVFPFP